jgi:hypothetical protein
MEEGSAAGTAVAASSGAFALAAFPTIAMSAGVTGDGGGEGLKAGLPLEADLHGTQAMMSVNQVHTMCRRKENNVSISVIMQQSTITLHNISCADCMAGYMQTWVCQTPRQPEDVITRYQNTSHLFPIHSCNKGQSFVVNVLGEDDLPFHCCQLTWQQWEGFPLLTQTRLLNQVACKCC